MMHKLFGNRYVKVGSIGALAFIITRTIIAITNTYIEPGVPYPFVLSLIAAVVISWFAAKAIRY